MTLIGGSLGPPFLLPEPALKTRTPMDDRILAVAGPVAAETGFRVVRVRVMGGKRKTVQIMAERRDGGMDVAGCATLSRALSDVFEADDPIDDEWVLEVSSPGIDRPLTELEDFSRWTGYAVKLELDRLVEGRKRFTGVLAGVEDSNVLIELKDEDEAALIPFAWIAEAKLVLTDALIRASLEASGQAVAGDNMNEDTP